MGADEQRASRSLRDYAVSAGIVTVLALVVWRLSGLPFWICFVMGLGALWVNGVVADWEDKHE
jgi:hypothetical protein